MVREKSTITIHLHDANESVWKEETGEKEGFMQRENAMSDHYLPK